MSHPPSLTTVADRVAAVRAAKLLKLRLHGTDELGPIDLSAALCDDGRGRAGVGGRKLKRGAPVTAVDAAEMYRRWRDGESFTRLGRAYSMDKSSVRRRIDRHMASAGLHGVSDDGGARS